MHGIKVALRAGAATAAIGLGAYLVAARLAPIVAIAAAAGALGFELTRVRATLLRRLDDLDADAAQVQPLLELRARLPTRHPLPAMREFAIAPDFALLLTELIAIEQPELVVETGSGVSTLVIGYALEKLGRGRVVALEHDPIYAARTRADIERHGLAAFASVVDAPLEPIAIGGERHRWYSLHALDGLDPIDLVLDDGPPRYLGRMLRYASLPTLAPRLSSRAVFVVDVIAEEERAILPRWKTLCPGFDQHFVPNKKGAVILRQQAAAPRLSSAVA
jgi:predicted O-methyltransferase YrrM